MTEQEVLDKAIDEANKLAKDYYQEDDELYITLSETEIRGIIKRAVAAGRREALRGN
jgi:predicted HAD superfamily phosphohydrolase